jgi:hypothetical protein
MLQTARSKRRLAGAVGAEDRGDAVLGNAEVDAVQDLRRPVLRGEAAHVEQRAVGRRRRSAHAATPR